MCLSNILNFQLVFNEMKEVLTQTHLISLAED